MFAYFVVYSKLHKTIYTINSYKYRSHAYNTYLQTDINQDQQTNRKNILLGCGHIFHLELLQSLVENANKCPTCKNEHKCLFIWPLNIVIPLYKLS
eukprot:UN13287